MVDQVSQSNAPKQLRLTDFIAAADRAGSFAKACRFFVLINPRGNVFRSYPRDLGYMCEAVEFPGRGFAVTQVGYYGPTQEFPIASEYQPASLSILCRSDSRERRFFDDWLDVMNPISNFNFEYAENYYCDVDIFQYAEYGTSNVNTVLGFPDSGNGTGTGTGNISTPQNSRNWQPKITYHWRLRYAWPKLVSPQPVTWAEQDVLRLQVTFAYKYWDRPQLLNTTT